MGVWKLCFDGDGRLDWFLIAGTKRECMEFARERKMTVKSIEPGATVSDFEKEKVDAVVQYIDSYYYGA